MAQFRLTQISDTHLARCFKLLTDNFHRVSEHIDATRPDLVLNSGDVSFDGPTSRDDLVFAREMHDALPADCRYLPGNHDIGDNPTAVGPTPAQLPTEESRAAFRTVLGDDRWQFEAAGWCFIGLNSLIMNTGLDSEAEQFDWLATQLDKTAGKPVALFLHKPLYLDTPDDPEREATAIRFVPQPARSRLIEMFGKVDLRLIGSGHVHQRRDYTFGRVRQIWAPSVGFIISDEKQERIGIKETGIVEYCFRPDGFEVRHVRAKGQADVDLDMLLGKQLAS
ncbi:metallophosphoesterase [Bradyrhizobium sp. ISRA443]|uniref:metallophosphoesterase family protein n=1 Tax=unclassified Bradyrhizobium TaxID=2631580 RepID=UPI002479ECBD|nr:MULTISPECIES: metallophosphoesterase [unclassified Bradyrhizobium]WGR92458.1 metallophosphoesterase [Bradyrhizobium sp. ISRA435]WGR96831.1 metallophosphoesterase [Bradyrhizobium sp. ISRA436]WGS03719.1 metallophosphoesterase [Bradyrhizobium sp. ISRA437]WGS10603.1 metallophosphoesterase [Bradyrhizobium sp. ISRA443]